MSVNEQLWEVIDRLAAGWRAIQTQIPKVLSDPRGYPREAMLLAALSALLLLVVLFAVFAMQDAVKTAAAARRLGVHPRRARRLRILLVVAAVAVVLVFVAAFAPLLPVGAKECGLCHAPAKAEALWRQDAHRSVGCLACHANQGPLGVLEAQTAGLARALSDSRTRRAANLAPSSSCLTCHDELASGVVTKDGLKVRHAEIFSAGMECRLCHQGVGHGAKVGDGTGSAAVARSIMSRCIVCHDDDLAPAGCSVCHIEAPLDVVTDAAPDGKTGADMRCDDSCHPKKVRRQCYDCHGLEMPHPAGFVRKHAGMSANDPALCAKCHESASPTLVCACHGDVNEHGTYSSWFPRHGSAARSVNNGAGCRCHAEQFCGKCHDAQVIDPAPVQ